MATTTTLAIHLSNSRYARLLCDYEAVIDDYVQELAGVPHGLHKAASGEWRFYDFRDHSYVDTNEEQLALDALNLLSFLNALNMSRHGRSETPQEMESHVPEFLKQDVHLRIMEIDVLNEPVWRTLTERLNERLNEIASPGRASVQTANDAGQMINQEERRTFIRARLTAATGASSFKTLTIRMPEIIHQWLCQENVADLSEAPDKPRTAFPEVNAALGLHSASQYDLVPPQIDDRLFHRIIWEQTWETTLVVDTSETVHGWLCAAGNAITPELGQRPETMATLALGISYVVMKDFQEDPVKQFLRQDRQQKPDG